MSQQTEPRSDQGLVIGRRVDGRRIVVSAAGELDLATVDALEAAALDALASTEEVALDLRELTFIDSTGLQLLVRLDAIALAGGRALTLAPSETVARLLALTGLERRFQRAAATVG